ncbi:rod shape-determining protein [Photobacterium lucens]|uniref:rod shape-determining protein n=1 Tax=Photobacterium lucens TaxID=2562949 RepID=UPI0006B503C4|nr:rod shape-determining protein [Photobacterium lucens]KPA51971.1 rod shape-determining protein MreB [Photobacterium leiognathi subsp. mandapamensis]MBP2699592.1 rod shape-determining protein MreB [Vibrio parahaemolyticus]MZG56895.1 rod shape-determining protein MreB [Photobacterium lucens]MZG81656.1 rod shape-determining protein MreB [Photobacterium lucens]
MALSLLQKLHRDLLVELSVKQLSVQIFGTGERVELSPYIAIETKGDKNIVLAVGDKAKSLAGSNITVLNPFDHKRSFVGNFAYAEKLLQYAVREVLSNHRFAISPRIVMHQLEKVEGGLTDIEERVLKELAMVAGAREVLVCNQNTRINTQHTTYSELKKQLSA